MLSLDALARPVKVWESIATWWDFDDIYDQENTNLVPVVAKLVWEAVLVIAAWVLWDSEQ